MYTGMQHLNSKFNFFKLMKLYYDILELLLWYCIICIKYFQTCVDAFKYCATNGFLFTANVQTRYIWALLRYMLHIKYIISFPPSTPTTDSVKNKPNTIPNTMEIIIKPSNAARWQRSNIVIIVSIYVSKEPQLDYKIHFSISKCW
jgi:hypothetical protein